MMIADLHIHTTASDGRFSPEEIVFHAKKAHLSHIAVTDHDTIDGVLDLQNKNQLHLADLEIIPGIEFSTDLPNHEVHILGYFIDITNTNLLNHLILLRQHRYRRVEKMLIILNHLGYSINAEDIQSVAINTASVGRSHVAQALVAKGYFSNIKEVFAALLNKNAPGYVPHYKLTPKEVIKLIKDSGGVPVLAHPGLVKSDSIVESIIKLGVLGIEAFHPKHSEFQIEKYINMAKAHHLALTGGSDFHGIPERFPDRLGVFTIPANLISNVKQLRGK